MVPDEEKEVGPARRKATPETRARGRIEREKENLEEGGPGGDRPDNSGRSRMGGPTKRVRAGRDCFASSPSPQWHM